MSDSDSFIEEVTEEVRRDRLFALMRRYGWIAILAVLVLVGGAAWHEWQKSRERARAEALGDAMLSAVQADDPAARVAALEDVDPDGPGSRAVIAMLAADALEDDPEAAQARLLEIADDPELASVYREVATLKAVMIPDGTLDPAARRERLDGLALGDGVMRMLADEQLAYLDIKAGDTQAAMDRLRGIRADAGATPGLRRRATQVIVALGGDVDTQVAAATGTGEDGTDDPVIGE